MGLEAGSFQEKLFQFAWQSATMQRNSSMHPTFRIPLQNQQLTDGTPADCRMGKDAWTDMQLSYFETGGICINAEYVDMHFMYSQAKDSA